MIGASGLRSFASRVAVVIAALGAICALVFGISSPAVAQDGDGKVLLNVNALGSPAKAGENLIYQISFSCSAFSNGCGTPTIQATVPALPANQYDGYQPQLEIAAHTDDVNVSWVSAEKQADGSIVATWKFDQEFKAGQANNVSFSLVSQNLVMPTSQDVTVTAVALDDAGEQLASDDGAGSFSAQYDPKVVILPTQDNYQPTIGYPFAYFVGTGIDGMVSEDRTNLAGQPKTGHQGITDVVQSVVLPKGVEFLRATGVTAVTQNADGTTTVTWQEQDAEQRSGTWNTASDAQTIEVKFTKDYTDGTPVTAKSTYTNLVTGEQGESTYEKVLEVAPGPTASGTFLKTHMLTYPASVSRGNVAEWGLVGQNSGAVPLRWEVVDMLPCAYVSPSDSSDIGCSTPALIDVKFQNTSDNLVEPITVSWTTNLGNTGSQAIRFGEGSYQPPMAAGEWITKVEINQVINAGARASLMVQGTVNPELEHKGTKDVGDYRNPEVLANNFYNADERQKSTTVIENCTNTGRLVEPESGDVVSDPALSCGYIKVNADNLKMWGEVNIRENLAR